MNEVRHPAVNAVVVTGVAERRPVRGIVAKFRIVLDRHAVVGFESPGAPAGLAAEVVAPQHGRLPIQIIGTPTSLVLGASGALRFALAHNAAIRMCALPLARATHKPCAAHLTGVLAGIPAAGHRAVDQSPHVRRRTGDRCPTRNASPSDFSRLLLATTEARAKPLFRVGTPRAVRLFEDGVSTSLTHPEFHASIIAKGLINARRR